MTWLFAGALLLSLSGGRAEAATLPAPQAVWMAGSDIETPQLALTRALRDALEAEVATYNPGLTPELATKAEVLVYLPEQVTLTSDAKAFRYNVLLTDREFHAFGRARGTCRSNRVQVCAHQIYQRLTAGEAPP